jgi:pimeloyl-ACP methyl ester carboxylesterase
MLGTPELLADLHPTRVLDMGARASVRYLDTGERGWHPVVFFGGLGTSAGAFSLTEFARPLRETLGLRFVSVERNGFGDTPFTPGLGFEQAVDDVLRVLHVLRIERFSVVAISGGGPYAGRLVARVPELVASLHLAAATSGGELLRCGAATAILADLEGIVADPEGFWEYPPESPVRLIPGFVEASRQEGERALGNPRRAASALAHELALLSSWELPDLREVVIPSFLYWGAHDELVPLEQARVWQTVLGPGVTLRVHPDSGHDVQYLHWHDILTDIAGSAVT